MSARKMITLGLIVTICWLPSIASSAIFTPSAHTSFPSSVPKDLLAAQLGWVMSDENNCGGYYLEEPFVYPIHITQNNSIEITSNQTLFSQRGTSILEGRVTATRDDQQITGNKAYLYRDPITGKLSAMDILGNVHFREPNTLVVAKKGHYNFATKTKSLLDLLYRTSIKGREIIGPTNVTPEQMRIERKVTGMTAWGTASTFSQTEPRIYELEHASYSTCPPLHPMWQVKASHLVLNKNTGRGYATNARVLIKNIPVFYIPYINFPIDSRRKTGFLMPTLGSNNQWGPYFLAPFYWNMAPNYDMTITPGMLSKRGLKMADNFRYLSNTSEGNIYASVLPNDRMFAIYQKKNKENPPNPDSQTKDQTQAELNRLLNDSTTRKSFLWRDTSQFNSHWSSHVDFNYAGDDYYLKNFGSNLNELTDNQLLQEADLYYKGENWNFTGRIQAYQTLHPLDSPYVYNQYRRFPQLILNGDYPDQPFGLEYFIYNEATNFEFLKSPGVSTINPVGMRFHTQPGISLPLSSPFFYITPRMQIALSSYNLQDTSPTPGLPPVGQTNAPISSEINRALPIFDIASGFSLYRDMNLFGYAFEQTLEPQAYYTFIPYSDQSRIPVFDTTDNTLTYDQLFNYNRFTGLDRIGDANQIGVGITSRLIDQVSGLEKVRMSLGGIAYFADRRVTLCTSNNVTNCNDIKENPANQQRFSPLSGMLDYHLNPGWQFTANPIWNPTTNQLDNLTLGLHYIPDLLHIVNFGYTYAHGGDPPSGISSSNSSDNLKVTDFSFSWPLPFVRDVSTVGRWSQNWNHAHLQNLLYGVQYDSCCWAVRIVGGRAYLGIDPTNNNRPYYNNEYYLQFSLKGLGNVGTGDPSGLLSRSISGYTSQFGQEI